MSGENLLKLYDVETKQVQASLDRLLRFRGIMGAAFAAVISATLLSKSALPAFLALGFLGIAVADRIYVRYLRVDQKRVEGLQVWIAERVKGVGDMADRYGRDAGYDHTKVGGGDWLVTIAYILLAVIPLFLALFFGFQFGPLPGG